MKLTLKEALEIFQAIGNLDGYQNGSDKLTLYKYPGDVRLKIAIARRKLRAVQEDFLDTRNGLIDKMSGDELTKTLNEMLKGEVEVDIEPLPVASFNLDDNPIPPSVLDMLGSFMK